MKVLIVTIALLAVLAMAKPHPMAGAFTDWMHEHGKSYSSEEFQTRFRIWLENKRFVDNFKGSHKVAMNRFGDLTAEEFAKVYLGTKPTLASKPRQETAVSSKIANPASVDWRTKGAVTGVKNQGQCGSCWSFSTTGSTEGAHAIKTGNLVSLSEQNLVDCSTSYGNQGCNGGLMDNAFQYIIANNGIDTEACYPYTAQDGTCAFKQSCVGATLTSYKDVTASSEAALETAVATVGPISVAIDAGTNAFQFYSGGVFYDSTCGNGPNDLDHGVLVVGYDQTSGGQQYWIVKNSWGADWGLNGYIWMSKNRDNNCGIATMASYPIA